MDLRFKMTTIRNFALKLFADASQKGTPFFQDIQNPTKRTKTYSGFNRGELARCRVGELTKNSKHAQTRSRSRHQSAEHSASLTFSYLQLKAKVYLCSTYSKTSHFLTLSASQLLPQQVAYS